jgi:hypothetical protein
LVFFVEDATGVRERPGLVAGFVSLPAVALRALLSGGEVARETLDPRLRLVGVLGYPSSSSARNSSRSVSARGLAGAAGPGSA